MIRMTHTAMAQDSVVDPHFSLKLLSRLEARISFCNAQSPIHTVLCDLLMILAPNCCGNSVH